MTNRFMVTLVLCAMAIISITTNSLAASDYPWHGPSDDSRSDYASGAGRKLGRGVANAGLGWLEIFKGVQDVGDENGFFAGATWGPIYGTVNAVRRTAAGVFETATFPIQNQDHFEPILEPEFVLQDQ